MALSNGKDGDCNGELPPVSVNSWANETQQECSVKRPWADERLNLHLVVCPAL